MYNVIKRDGKIVDFNLSKISEAITMAFEAQEKDLNQKSKTIISLLKIFRTALSLFWYRQAMPM